jgi:hypothetical protein
MSGLSQSKEVFEVIEIRNHYNVIYKTRCKLCGYVIVTTKQDTGIKLMREHLKDTHNIKI